MKPHKSVLKRIKITKTGKLLRRVSGKNHFNAKMSRKVQLREKSSRPFPKDFERQLRAFM